MFIHARLAALVQPGFIGEARAGPKQQSAVYRISCRAVTESNSDFSESNGRVDRRTIQNADRMMKPSDGVTQTVAELIATSDQQAIVRRPKESEVTFNLAFWQRRKRCAGCRSCC